MAKPARALPFNLTDVAGGFDSRGECLLLVCHEIAVNGMIWAVLLQENVQHSLALVESTDRPALSL